MAGETRRSETRQPIRLAGTLAASSEFGSVGEVYSTVLSSFLTQVLEQLDQLSNLAPKPSSAPAGIPQTRGLKPRPSRLPVSLIC